MGATEYHNNPPASGGFLKSYRVFAFQSAPAEAQFDRDDTASGVVGLGFGTRVIVIDDLRA